MCTMRGACLKKKKALRIKDEFTYKHTHKRAWEGVV